ncbi:MAG: GNAT family N-acetyltransferase [Spirochaetes bacterium]|nr:GNAT family N-acetyltransferase [Spirochaetota bacterium]
MLIRDAEEKDVEALQELYAGHLAKTPPTTNTDITLWRAFLETVRQNENYHLLVLEVDGSVWSSVTLILIPNLTHGMKPYALIENVVTHSDHRGRGYATALMSHASQIAFRAGAYKIMLMTGSKKESTHGFYENCGFTAKEKTAFVKRFDES